jgi:AmiR/NasT family two-component response regulator
LRPLPLPVGIPGRIEVQPRAVGRETILSGVLRVGVAEDEAIIRMDLVEILTEEGYEVVGAVGNGEDALTLVEAQSPDVMLVDIAMPRLDGLAVTRLISERTAVVLVTAFDQRDLVEQATSAGAMGYLVKPVGRSDVMPAIEVAAARWAKAAELSDQASDLAQRLADRRDVERAKALLMARGQTEDAAFAKLRRGAMDGRISLGESARRELGKDSTSGSAFSGP